MKIIKRFPGFGDHRFLLTEVQSRLWIVAGDIMMDANVPESMLNSVVMKFIRIRETP